MHFNRMRRHAGREPVKNRPRWRGSPPPGDPSPSDAHSDPTPTAGWARYTNEILQVKMDGSGGSWVWVDAFETGPESPVMNRVEQEDPAVHLEACPWFRSPL